MLSYCDAKFIHEHVCRKKNTSFVDDCDMIEAVPRYIHAEDVDIVEIRSRVRKRTGKTAHNYNKDVIFDVIRFSLRQNQRRTTV